MIAAGQIARHKGIDVLIESVAEVRKQGFDNIQVDIYGNVEDNEFPTRWSGHLKLDDHVSLQEGRGPRPSWRGSIRLYDIFAFPTWQREP